MVTGFIEDGGKFGPPDGFVDGCERMIFFYGLTAIEL
jgi:hypothetical protein